MSLDSDARIDLIDQLVERFLLGPDGQWRPEEDWPRLLKDPCEGDERLLADVCAFAKAVRDEPDGQPEVSVSLRASSESPGTIIGRYEIKRLIGRGGMGEVYEVLFRAERFSQSRALKLANAPPPGIAADAYLKRFHREEMLIASLDHPNIARVFEDGTYCGRPYFVMELVPEALSIDEYCRIYHLPIANRLRLFSTACRTVHFAHTRDVLHRDLKPSNILVSSSGEVKVLDFGLATLSSKSHPHTPGVLPQVPESSLLGGTPNYMSPEQRRGEALTPATDIFSLGAVLSDVLSGCPEYLASDRRQKIDLVIFRAQRPSPMDRYQTATELATNVESLLHDETPSGPSSASPRDPRRRWVTVLVAATIVSIGLYGLYARRQITASPSTPSASEIGKATSPPADGGSKIEKKSAEKQRPGSVVPSLTAKKTTPEPAANASGSERTQSTIENIGKFPAQILKYTPTGEYPQIFLSGNGKRILILDLHQSVDSFGQSKYSTYARLIDVQTSRILVEKGPFPPGSLPILVSNALEYAVIGCTLLHFDTTNGRAEHQPLPLDCQLPHNAYLAVTDSGEVIYRQGNLLTNGVRKLLLPTLVACSSDNDVLIIPTEPNHDCKPERRYVSDYQLYDNKAVNYVRLRNLSIHPFPGRIHRGSESFTDYRALGVVDEGKTIVGIRGRMIFLADALDGSLLRYGLAPTGSEAHSRVPTVLHASRTSDSIVMNIRKQSDLFRWPGTAEEALSPLILMSTPGQGNYWQVSADGSVALYRSYRTIWTVDLRR